MNPPPPADKRAEGGQPPSQVGNAATGPKPSHSNTYMQSMPDARLQSYDEIYGPPENFLEIEVLKDVLFFSLPLLV